ncbi:MAG: DUF4065 domain-containing protein [Lachnospiraceae bacterium]|nr:DUF4065 domain-containing protein [Lachnospiraceae bacterium]
MNENIFDSFEIIKHTASITESSDSNTFGNIFDLANSFLSIQAMTHKKLQKLCYYAKAWYLAFNDENLIEESFEAWVHGAVQPSLYHKYRSYGFQFIPMFTGNLLQLPEEFLSFSREIFKTYGEYSGDELEKINHQEFPWINARKGLKPWQSSNVIISEDDMKSYYRSLMRDE